MRTPEQVIADRLCAGLTVSSELAGELRARALQAARDCLADLREESWIVARIERETGSTAHEMAGHWQPHGRSSVHMNGPCYPVVVLTEEWTPVTDGGR